MASLKSMQCKRIQDYIIVMEFKSGCTLLSIRIGIHESP